MCKPTQFVIMSLVLFMTVLLIGAVSNESVNKDKSVLPSIPPPLPSSSVPVASVAAAPAIPLSPAHGIIADHMDLPTKFGDEDDVIEGKAAAEKKASVNAGIGSSASRNDDDDEHYDEDDDFLSRHISDKSRSGGSHHRDNDESEVDYDDSDLGPTLDNFGAKLDGSDAGNELPIFLEEPQNAYAVRNRAATLKCKAAHALELTFKCSGSSHPPPSQLDSHVDPHTGVSLREVTATISKDLVYEYFGKSPFKCDCHAWSPRGKAKSQSATIEVA
ncbi:netrin receptor unc-5-like, partial [Contarinia nasturtii]|uniref:netrin receptor unc-5-like n=1 Tax=Contarinia nasturtii TaxID=265458 RepID=UPI0012D46460